MGLSASQVRLLSLTSRQHSIEGEAHRLQANKLRLSNDSDTAYMKYLNALDDTFLKTMQTRNDSGKVSWIDASINNLMRYQTSDETTGKVFYVQDIGTGKLYIPKELGDKFDSSTGMREFVTACDPSIEYEEVTENEAIEKQYQKYLDLGYDKVLAPTIAESNQLVAEYYSAVAKEDATINVAKNAVNAIPYVSAFGNHVINSQTSGVGISFVNAIKDVISKSEYNTLYTAEEKAVIEGSLSLMDNIGLIYPQDYSLDNADTVQNITYSPTKIISKANGETYTSYEGEYNKDQLFLSMLNGGTIVWNGKETTVTKYKDGATNDITCSIDYSVSHDIYDIDISANGYVMKAKDVLQNYNGSTTFGAALISALRRVSTSPSPLTTFLNSNGITADDIKHYQEYRRAAELYETYEAVVVWKASDSVKAAYYEEIYKSIKAAGGWIEASEAVAKNGTWVSNMVKNAQVIITDWDEEKEILTNTTTALITNIKEVTDQNYIERVSQEYEDTLNEINAKDTRYDKRLAQLETERSAIMTEVDGLKEVMKNNIEKTFKVFG